MANTITKNHKINTDTLKRDVRRLVIEAIREIFDDPDYGLPLTPFTIGCLKKSIKSKKEGRLIGLDEILKKDLKKEKIRNKERFNYVEMEN